jgi:hypothetical protein
VINTMDTRVIALLLGRPSYERPADLSSAGK